MRTANKGGESTTEQISDVELFKQLDEVTKEIASSTDKLTALQRRLEQRKSLLRDAITDKAEAVRWSKFVPMNLNAFVEEPYVIEPYRLDKKGRVLEWRVYVPKFVSFQVGRLERATHSYNVYTVNQYMRWFAEIPEELESRFPQIDVELKVHDGVLTSPPEQTEQTWEKYKHYLLKREAPGILRIKKGSEWGLISQILEEGGLPFVPQAVDQADLRQRSFSGFALHKDWTLRDYQKEAIDRFLEYGAAGIYYPFGTGKSEIAIDLCDQLRGHKLIIAGASKALKEQWEERLKAMPSDRRAECHIVVYQSQREIDELVKRHKEFILIIFDECHHLPAQTFMRLSTIPTKYRLGLTGSPYREDGHINYILALTGYPVGMAWAKFVTEGIISLAQVQVHVVRKPREKLVILDELLKRDLGKTMIFCDSLDLGDEISKKYGIPFVHGETKSRLEVINRNDRLVISRVGDEGISVPALDTLIEIDFLGGSRYQALQRVGRLSHRLIKADQEPAVHHVLITEEEVEKYGKRILSFYDKGFKVDWIYGY